MTKRDKNGRAFFERLCADYYEKVLRYLFGALENESAARDCAQEVFLTACQKRGLLAQHPNPGGFLFQTAKNLAHKTRRESYRRMITDSSIDDAANKPADDNASIDSLLDSEIDEQQYIEAVLSRLSDEKRRLYAVYYLEKKNMSEIAAIMGISEAAVRMRYVRLRREIRAIISEVSEQYFSS